MDNFNTHATFKILHQTIAINDIDFSSHTIHARTELEVLLLDQNAQFLTLNCRQCLIHQILISEPTVVPLKFQYYDPLSDVLGSVIESQDSNQPTRSLAHLCETYFGTVLPSVETISGGGELFIELPSNVVRLLLPADDEDQSKVEMNEIKQDYTHLTRSKSALHSTSNMNLENGANIEVAAKMPNLIFKIQIQYSLQDPKAGIAFRSIPSRSQPSDAAYHYVLTTSNSSRLWFPCLDTCSHVCTWRLEITISEPVRDRHEDGEQAPYTVIASGDLVDVVVEEGPETKLKTYCYSLSMPTAASYIGFVAGHFEMSVDPHMHELTNFCLPGLTDPPMAYTTSQVHTIFEFYEELLSSRFPYACYKQVFVEDFLGAQAEEPSYLVYATFSILDVRLLYPPDVIDQIWRTRKYLAQAIATQFFGRFLSPSQWSDHWLTAGISSYITGLYMQKIFGNNEYRYEIFKRLEQLYEFETSKTPILLDPSRVLSDIWSAKHAHKKEMKKIKRENGTRVEEHISLWPTLALNKNLACVPYLNLHPQLASTTYLTLLETKATLFVRMIEMRIGKNMLIQVFNKLLTLASNATQSRLSDEDGVSAWSHFLISVPSFIKFIYTVTGKDLQSFFDLWVYQAGVVNIQGSYSFSRKKSLLELDIRQEINKKAHFKYVGPLQVRVQEMDGNFTHTINVEETNRKYDLPCQSKTKTYRNKKKKVPLFNGDEADIDLTMAFETECPVLWITLDPDAMILGSTWQGGGIRQPDYQWQMMLRYERDVISQCKALRTLTGFSRQTPSRHLLKGNQAPSATLQTRNLLNEIIEDTTLFIINLSAGGISHPHQLSSSLALHSNSNNPNSISNLLSNLSTGLHEPNYNHHFYRIRIDTCFALAAVANSMAESWVGPPAMLNLARKLFGTPGCNHIVRKNNFSDFQSYFLQSNMPLALCQLRTGSTVRQICPPEIISYLFDCVKYNDNSENKFSDYQLRANLMTAIANIATPSSTLFDSQYHIQDSSRQEENISLELKKILTELTCQLNLEKLPHNASYRYNVTISCLFSIRHLQKMGHLPIDYKFFKSYATIDNFIDVRMAALEAVIEIIKDQALLDEFNWILTNILENEYESSLVKHLTLQILVKSFETKTTNVDTNLTSKSNVPSIKKQTLSTYIPMSRSEEIVIIGKLWALMNDNPSYVLDDRLRCDVIQFVYAVYGNKTPPCLEDLSVENSKETNELIADNQAENQLIENVVNDENIATTLDIKTEPEGVMVDMELDDQIINKINENSITLSNFAKFPSTSTSIRQYIGPGGNLNDSFNAHGNLKSSPFLPLSLVPSSGKTLNFQDKFKQHLLKEENLSSAQSSHTEKGSVDDLGDRDDQGSPHTKKTKKKKHKHHKKHKTRHEIGETDLESYKSKEHKHKHSKKSKRKRSSS